MSLRDKLKIYEKQAAGQQRRDPTGALLNLGGEKLIVDDKEIWRFSFSYPLPSLNITPSAGDPSGGLGPFYKYNRFPVDLSGADLVFLDLETTALSIGAGSYAFLIGIGRLSGDAFIVEQYFMHDYSAEDTILRHILPLFRNAKAAVTYNGKTFDMPLLKNRYRMNRVPGFPVNIPVIDLLYPCRRVFRNIYESCTLKSIEENLLGIHREGDIPGWLIPEVFFSFQKGGETDRLGVVLEHNRLDIKALFMLIYQLNELYHHVENRSFDRLDLKIAINLAHQLHVSDRAAFIELAVSLGTAAMQDRLLFKKFSGALKRSGRLQEALDFWTRDGSIFSLEELAKYYEHREKNHEHALVLCTRAQSLISGGIFSPRGEVLPPDRITLHRERFAHRIERLVRKKNHR